MKILVELADNNLTSHAGLVLIGPYLKSKDFRRAIDRVSTIKKTSGVISDVDIICCWIALLSLGKSDYASIEEYRNNQYFKDAIGIDHVPSEAILRQRIETLPEAIETVLREFSFGVVATGFDEAKHHSVRNHTFSETLLIGDTPYSVIDSDVSVLDNSDSHKEGVEWTYKRCDGYAPMFSYMGASGYMLNCELREGSMHSNASGTHWYFQETIDAAKEITDHRLLMVLDSGNDDKKILDLFEENGVSYVVKRNHRQEPVLQWLALAQDHETHRREGRDGSIVYYASTQRDVVVEDRKRTIRIVIVARERFCDEHGQLLLDPERSAQTYWTNLPCAERLVEKVYHMHGTMEQYHSELKSDLGVERLPSGKFHPNSITLLCSMIAFNLLRRVGMKMLKSGKAPGKRGKRGRRLRLRTVLQSVMYMAAAIISHGGRIFLRICGGHAWAPAFYSSV